MRDAHGIREAAQDPIAVVCPATTFTHASSDHSPTLTRVRRLLFRRHLRSDSVSWAAMGAGGVLLHGRFLCAGLLSGRHGVRVYAGRDETSGDELLIKQAAPGHRFRCSAVEREARLPAAVQGPHLLSLVAYDTGEERPFVAARRVPGRTLESLVCSGPMRVPTVCRIALAQGGDLLCASREPGAAFELLMAGAP